MLKGLLSLVLVFGFAVYANAADEKVVENLQDISVTINSGTGEGSGVLITRKRDNDNFNFVWTAAHVVDNLRTVRSIVDSKTGTQKQIVEFNDAKIIKTLTDEGRTVGKLEMFAQVFKFNMEEDLAILRVRKKNFVSVNAKFYNDAKIPVIGTDLLHVGSLLGQMGANSLTKGIVSQHGRLVDNKIFDQVAVSAFPGSSGGGVYMTDGRLVGLILRGAGENFNLMVPIRRMKEWTKENKIEWALDEKIPLPSEADLKKIVVEDIGVNFDPAKANIKEKELKTLFKILPQNKSEPKTSFDNDIYPIIGNG